MRISPTCAAATINIEAIPRAYLTLYARRVFETHVGSLEAVPRLLFCFYTTRTWALSTASASLQTCILSLSALLQTQIRYIILAIITGMSINGRSASRGCVLVRASSRQCLAFVFSRPHHDHPSSPPSRSLLSSPPPPALQNSILQAVAEWATCVLRPLTVRFPAPMTTRTHVAESPSLRAIPTW